MKSLSRSKGMVSIDKVKAELRVAVSDYERRAKDCGSCDTRGACCLDAHFVNVRISRLEAEAINSYLDQLAPEVTAEIRGKIDKAIDDHGLDGAGSGTYACPLFVSSIGCLVHNAGKPAACIAHACYESRKDMPPDDLLESCELEIDSLNTQVYLRPQPWLAIPLALREYPAGHRVSQAAISSEIV